MSGENKGLENVRLVVWDLDETFWDGTLGEGGVSLIERNVEIVKTLNARGIVNSICSKNDYGKVRATLERFGLVDEFVFMRVAYEPKGAMVKSIVESAQLRTESVMFVDDNPINLNEVRHYNPGIQLAGPEFLPDLLADRRFKGKDDSELTRLKQYKILEQKEVDRSRFVDDANAFLRESEVQVSFHYDVMEEFDRIHELINRTNQLNFTKLRLPEDPAEARAVFEGELAARDCHAAYVKVSDKYGAYGIVGFYMTKPGVLRHFVFSCRTLNMGIEQFVFRRLGGPKLVPVGEVVSNHLIPAKIDWISVVADAEARTAPDAVGSTTVCVRGACELDQVTHYLRHLNITREFTYPYRGWGISLPLTQLTAIRDAVRDQENDRLFDRMHALPRKYLESMVFSRSADVYVLSFSLEPQWGNYRYKKTGMIVPLRVQKSTNEMMDADLTTLTYEQLKAGAPIEMSREEWAWFLENFEYVDHFNQDRFAENLDRTLDYLEGKTVLIVQLNAKFSNFKRKLAINAQINAAVERVAARHDVKLIEIETLIREDAEALSANHFVREVYQRLADAITAALKEEGAETAAPALLAAG